MTQDILAARIDGLVQAMSLEEKLRQLTMIRTGFGDVGRSLAGRLRCKFSDLTR
jgi:hypothetical protein